MCRKSAYYQRLGMLLLVLFGIIGSSQAGSTRTFDLERLRDGDPSLPPVTREQHGLDDQIFGLVKRAEVAFLQDSYDLELARDYNQVFPIEIFNTTDHPFVLYTEIAHGDQTLVAMNTVGVGSITFPAVVDGEQKRTIFVKAHLQNYTKPVLEAKLILREFTTREVYDQIPLRIRLKPASYCVELIKTEDTLLSKAKTITLKNAGDSIADCSIFFESGEIQSYMNPAIIHRRFESNTQLTFDLIPLLDGQLKSGGGDLVITTGDAKQQFIFPLTFQIEEDEEYFPNIRTSLCSFDILTHRNMLQSNGEVLFNLPYWQMEALSTLPKITMGNSTNLSEVDARLPLSNLHPKRRASQDQIWIEEDWNKDGNADIFYPKTIPASLDNFVSYINQREQWYKSNIEAVYAEIHLTGIHDIEWITPGNLFIYFNDIQLAEAKEITPQGTLLVPLPLALFQNPDQQITRNKLACYLKGVNSGSLVMLDKVTLWVRYTTVDLQLIKKKNRQTRLTNKRNFYWDQAVVALSMNTMYAIQDSSWLIQPINLGYSYAQAGISITCSNQNRGDLSWTGNSYESASSMYSFNLAKQQDNQPLLGIQTKIIASFPSIPAQSAFQLSEVPRCGPHWDWKYLLGSESEYIATIKAKRANPLFKAALDNQELPFFHSQKDSLLFQTGLTGECKRSNFANPSIGGSNSSSLDDDMVYEDDSSLSSMDDL